MKQAIGQAKFWRAYAYFTLVRIFGDIPLTLDNENDDFTMTPSSVEKVYEQIVADLTSEECESLPDSYKDAPAFMNGVNVYVTRLLCSLHVLPCTWLWQDGRWKRELRIMRRLLKKRRK